MSWTTSQIMSIFLERLPEDKQWVRNNLLFLHVAGSRLYGINKEDSDYDVRGVVLAPKKYWVASHEFEQLEMKLPDANLDFVVYDFRKWLKLTIQGNPNVLETLYVQSENPNVVFESPRWSRIKTITRSLMSKKAYQGFRGYSLSQLQKMVTKQSNKTGRQHITQKYGFDLKFASHGFRHLQQGSELLNTGDITFPRPEKDQLKAIRNGEIYGPEDIGKCNDDWLQDQKVLDDAYENSILPDGPNYEVYNELLEAVFDTYVNTNSRNINEKVQRV